MVGGKQRGVGLHEFACLARMCFLTAIKTTPIRGAGNVLLSAACLLAAGGLLGKAEHWEDGESR